MQFSYPWALGDVWPWASPSRRSGQVSPHLRTLPPPKKKPHQTDLKRPFDHVPNHNALLAGSCQAPWGKLYVLVFRPTGMLIQLFNRCPFPFDRYRPRASLTRHLRSKRQFHQLAQRRPLRLGKILFSPVSYLCRGNDELMWI